MLVSNGEFIYLGKNDKVSKNGVPFSLVEFADAKNYQRLEYFADANITIACGEGAKCKFTIKAEKRGYKTEHACVSIVAA